ncbi:ThiF family adenylyltransferase [Kaistella flava (ex Peng et al. 2021)]|uniref:ThiF family adenylyltransferase n=1 Tax=Kaistella flava (ex Peng et al. 2021) TaxID=2038776 RepID=UPI00293BAC95|nr:ThiF family adenylyltransferase [Kaistella flava (ex Peng et al. 2021)]
MKNFSIVIAGSGIGSNIAECALRTGFEKICVIDGDLIEDSNLNRQNYTEDHIGTSKAMALYERLKSINANAEITFVDQFISRDNIPETGTYHVGINALDYTNEAPQLFDESCLKSGIPVIHPYNVGWGGLVTVLSPKGPPLQLLKKSSNFNEVDMVEYAASYQRFWQNPQIWLEEVINHYRTEDLALPPPQLAIGSWYVAAMCTHLLVKIATGKFYKKFPEFYLRSLLMEE